ncbi:MAG: sensor histidine kinase [Lachnospiraceae bacterium]|nr:sensor histidine kinase [Lachnospiraceae bacterium]
MEIAVDRKDYPRLVLSTMKNLNMVIILYLTMVTVHSLSGYIAENSAMDFLLRAKQVPAAPWKLPVIAVGLYLCLLLLLSIPCRRKLWFLLKTLVELGIVFAVSSVLSFGYTGTVLLIIADTMSYFPDRKQRILFVAGIFAAYLLMDYDLLSARYSIISLETCWAFYSGRVQSLLLGVRNILNSLNMIVFISYTIVLILEEVKEKERIQGLNERLRLANQELRLANEKLEEYAKESEKTAETRERNRLAREIHDTLGHSLTGIITGIDACVMLVDIAPEATKEQLKAIANVARQGVKDVRRSVKALRPDALETLDLQSAIIQMIEEIRRSTGVDIDERIETRLNGLNKDEEDVIYRIIQESITNAIRHGKADKIKVKIDRQYNMLNIHVEDNGVGCANVQKGFGLHHMEERLAMLKGSLSYCGDHGFIIDAGIPIRWGTEDEND